MTHVPSNQRNCPRCLLVIFVLLNATVSSAQPNDGKSNSVVAAQRRVDSDVCVYGGTSGGVIAAVQVARMGKRVVLVEPGRHLGGLTSGGLSAVDIGDPRSVGGITREYFTRLVATYGKTLNWGEAFQGKGGPATGGAYSIEPHVAERVFDELAKEAGVIVLGDARLKSVSKDGSRITELLTDDGRSVRAKMFIDTTYEGDLMAAAGVSFTLMREGNAKYGETYNGIHYTAKYKPRTDHKTPGANGRVPGGQGVWDRDFPLDPYVLKGDPSSGLLPLINEGEPGNQGDPAPGVMAYCFRLCLSTADDRLPITPPPDYEPKNYELVVRFIEACLAIGDRMDLRWFSKHDPLPNSKWDFNTATFGGNLPGASWEWPEASYNRRIQISKDIENYHRGLLHFLATDPRVPESVRSDMRRFGLPKDEFTDNGGWPHQLYIREGRRMVSDLVLTEHHTFGRTVAPNPVSLGSYGTDVHEIRRIVKDGVVTREGKVASGRGGAGPYPIGYGAIVPKQEECDNLFVTFALSASHTAFASIRMEPVFMATSQSAATAACLAIDRGTPVQQVDYVELQKQLVSDGQVLEWRYSKTRPRRVNRPKDLPGIVLDDSAAKFTGTWVKSSAQRSLIGASYQHDANSDRGQKHATFTPEIPTTGEYEVRFLYAADRNRSSRTKITVLSADGEKSVSVDQRSSVLVDRIPRAIGTFRFEAGTSGSVVVSNEGADGYVSVDGLQLVPVELARKERAGERNSGFVQSGIPQESSRIAGITIAEEPKTQILRELIRPDDMKPDDGVSYIARLQLSRKGERDSGASVCRLLEDGKPLPHPHSRHAEIRQRGKGRYSHWAATQLYFSASDSSDPRTNGRRYELVSDETFVRRTARAIVTKATSLLSIDAAADCEIRPARLVLTNLDKQVSIVPHIRHRDDPDLTSVDSILASITNDKMIDEEKAIAIWKFLVDWRYHDYPAEERAEMHDPVKLINVYGYGFCDDSAAAFSVLADRAGLKSRSHGLSGHVVGEAFFGDGWHMFDPDHQVFYRTKAGHVASVAELETQPELITSKPTDPLGFPSRRMAQAYTTREDNRPFQARRSISTDLRPMLAPGDRVVFDFQNTQRVHRRSHLDKPLPQSFGNGMLIQKRTVNITPQKRGSIEVNWPYVILGGTIELQADSELPAATVSVSADGQSFVPLNTENDGTRVIASLDSWIDAQPAALYQYWLRVEPANAGVSSLDVSDIILKTAFQFAPRAHAKVRRGANDFQVDLRGHEAELPADWSGVRVELVWDEMRKK